MHLISLFQESFEGTTSKVDCTPLGRFSVLPTTFVVGRSGLPQLLQAVEQIASDFTVRDDALDGLLLELGLGS